MIYHIASRAAWLAAQRAGRYSAPSLETEGFIHCSAREQVLAVAAAFYADQADLLLLCIDEGKLGADLRWEAAAHPAADAAPPAMSSLFPHVYGPLNLDAVIAAVALPLKEDGFALPADLP